jgi:23S rRNA (adenine2503-C2)-methyltransferase
VAPIFSLTCLSIVLLVKNSLWGTNSKGTFETNNTSSLSFQIMMAIIAMSTGMILSRAIGETLRNGRRSPAFIVPFQTFNAAAHRTERTYNSHIRRPSTCRPVTSQPIDEPSLNYESQELFKVNLLTIPLEELETLLKSWSYPAFRARQIHNWIFSQGVKDIDQMSDLPLKLRDILKERTTIGSLHLEVEQISNDGTKKRAYKLHDGQMIESVLMPYEDGRRTACISSQAGCAMGCVFCATGQMGFARQLTSDEIFEQVATFANELKGEGERLSNVVMMGMGEPLANYKNVLAAIRRMNTDLGIGARRITISTVGVVPNIRKLMNEELNVRLALSLHCATDDERTALLPANRRYGGLDELMTAIREFIQVRKQRVTFEWALIEGENDSKDVARSLGKLLRKHDIRPDMAHVNLIPLNPTGGYGGGPAGRKNVAGFVEVLENEFGISATPRMRRGIDIDAGCGQLTTSVKKKEDVEKLKEFAAPSLPVVGVYEDEEVLEEAYPDAVDSEQNHLLKHGSIVEFAIDDAAIDLDNEEHAEDFVDPVYEDELDLSEADRLIALVKGTTIDQDINESHRLIALVENASIDEQTSQPQVVVKSTTVTDEDAVREAKRRRKKLLKNLKAIGKLKDIEATGKVLNEEQQEKVDRESEWLTELESLEHNLM